MDTDSGILLTDPLDDPTGLALRLALGTSTRAERVADWDRVFDIASREMLAPLAWLRSGQVIRTSAPPPVVRAWRRTALAANLRGQRQLALLRDASGALAERRVDAVVLKGLPLGDRLYGDPFVRCCADIDLYVPAPQRDDAATALETLGWERLDGNPPWHETWSIWRDDAAFHLELHSSLVSDHLAHLPVGAPLAVSTSVGGESVRAHTGAFVAPYLAAHLATHQMPPLLWLVDFATLWQRSSAESRAHSERAARSAGLGRYLAWARERSALIERAAGGDRTALGALGFGGSQRRDVHSIWRHLVLQPSWPDRARLAVAFLAPRPARRDVRTLVRHTLARLRTRLRSLAGASRTYDASPVGDSAPIERRVSRGARALTVDREEFVSLSGDVIRAGGAVWVRAPGGSMIPTVARGALVCIAPIPEGGIVKGDVVLTLTSDGEPVLHRVTSVENGWIATRGDAAIHSDPPVPLRRVIGVATRVRDVHGERPIGRRAKRSMAVTALKLRRPVARVVGRAR